MDYILMTIQLTSMGLTYLYIEYFLRSISVEEDTNSGNNNTKKYVWKLLSISVVAFIISILNVQNCDFVSKSEMITVLRWYVVFIIANVFMYSWTYEDVVYSKSKIYEK